MKILLTWAISLIVSFSFAQKPKQFGINCKFRHLRYPENIQFSANQWAVTIIDQSREGDLLHQEIRETPLNKMWKSARIYSRLIGSKPGYYEEASKNRDILDATETPYIYYRIEKRDIVILEQEVTDNGSNAGESRYNLVFTMRTPVFLTATFRGDTSVVLLDTNNFTFRTSRFTFPRDAKLGKGEDIKPKGYPSEVELFAAWQKYGKQAEEEWSEKMTKEFLRPVCSAFIQEFIQYEEQIGGKIYTDKNKKGGFDDLVNAAEIFRNTMDEIDADYQAGSLMKMYTEEYQRRLIECRTIWDEFLKKYDYDVLSQDGRIKAEHKQKILLNYILSLIFTKEFEEAEKLINQYRSLNLRSSVSSDLRTYWYLNEQLRDEYRFHAEAMGWK